MDCDGGSDSGNWGAVGINGTRPMDSHLYQKDGKPSSPEAKELSGTQEHPVWLVRPAWLGSPPPSSHSHHWVDTPPFTLRTCQGREKSLGPCQSAELPDSEARQ